ncbi:MAG TPA: site-2 protease family protein, partial [Usitatibacter sp.]|nr:site-2 protease family protein [Usitatibacter sp.]
MLEFLFIACGALALGVALTVFLTAVKASRVRLRPMDGRRIDLTRAPAAARGVLDIGRAWLLPRGFRYQSSWVTRPLIVSKRDDVRFSDVYVDEAGTVFAGVSLRDNPQPGDLVNIEFTSVFADGTLLTTTNRYRHCHLWEPPWWKIDDPYEANLDKALERHRQRVAGEGKPPSSDAAFRDQVCERLLKTYVDELLAAGVAVRAPDGETRLRFMPALRFAWRLIRGNFRMGLITPVPLKADAAPLARVGSVDAGIEADMKSYQARRAVSAATSGKGKWMLGLVSALAFVAVGAMIWNAMLAVGVLLVIALHEGGHYLAMKLVGYRNLHVFFLPGLGGLATGEKQDATPAQKVFVYLAGPVPGIALATALYILVPNGTLAAIDGADMLLTIMLVINVLNLLPVTPLDGGRVMEVLLFARWPTLRFLFAMTSCAVLLAWGLLFGETVMLLIGVLVFLALPGQWRFSRLARKIPRKPGEAYDEPAAARKVFGVLATEPFTKWNFQKRALAADELIAELRTPVPGIFGVAGGLAIYAACFVVPVAAAVASSQAFRETAAMAWEARDLIAEIERDAASRGPRRDFDQELEAKKDAPPEERLALMVEAIEQGYLGEPYLAEMNRLARERPPGDALRGRALLGALKHFEEEPSPEMQARHREKLRMLHAEFRDAQGDALLAKGRIGMTLAEWLEDTKERIALSVESRDILRDRVPPGDSGLSTGWQRLAQDRMEVDPSGREAEEEWKALIAWHAADPTPTRLATMMGDSAHQGYVQLLVKQGRLGEAEALLRPDVESAIAAAAAGKGPGIQARSANMSTLFWL